MDEQYMLRTEEPVKLTHGIRNGIWSASKYLDDLHAKAAAMDRVLASWGMTWEEYQTGTDTPNTGDDK